MMRLIPRVLLVLCLTIALSLPATAFAQEGEDENAELDAISTATAAVSGVGGLMVILGIIVTAVNEEQFHDGDPSDGAANAAMGIGITNLILGLGAGSLSFYLAASVDDDPEVNNPLSRVFFVNAMLASLAMVGVGVWGIYSGARDPDDYSFGPTIIPTADNGMTLGAGFSTSF